MELKTLKNFITFSELFDTRASDSSVAMTPFLPITKYGELIKVLESTKREDINVEGINKLFYYILEGTKQSSEYTYPFMPFIDYLNEDKFNNETLSYFLNRVTDDEVVGFVDGNPGLDEKLMNWVDFFDLIEKYIDTIHNLGFKWWMDDTNFSYLRNLKNAFKLARLICDKYERAKSSYPSMERIKNYYESNKKRPYNNDIVNCFGREMGLVWDYPSSWKPKEVEKGWIYTGPYITEYKHFDYNSSI